MFDFGAGYCYEVGVHLPQIKLSWIMYGTSGSWSINHVKNSQADFSFYTPYYTEFRYDLSTMGDACLFSLVGFDWNRMHYEKSESDGADNQYLLSLGIGGYLNLGKIFIQPKIKPYYVISNSLGQNFGISFQVNIGLNLATN
jgi:hypothetical protein